MKTSADLPSFDMVIVGAGIVGLATGLRLLERSPDLRLAIVDKEATIAAHQTGHNSGVLHSGLYYAPGSTKARLCRAGKAQLESFAAQHGIPVEYRGKLVVALDEAERERLLRLAARGEANGVPGLRLLGPDGIREHEPYAAGKVGLWSPTTAVIDFRQVAETMASLIRRGGGVVETGREVTGLQVRPGELVLVTTRGPIASSSLITCAGVFADRLADLTGDRSGARIVPFRGACFRLTDEARLLVRGLLYPVPDPRFPFLGVHFTRRIDGDVWAGPNAVLALARDGYRWPDVNLRDVAATLAHPGFLRLTRQYWRTGGAEMLRDFSKRLFQRNLRRYLPELRLDHLLPGPSGVRAQLLSRAGTLVDDFVLSGKGRVLHVLNAPSPAATASLAIGDRLASLALERFEIHDRTSGLPGARRK